MKQLPIIGRAEKIDILDLGYSNVPAKVDTGADLSSIWVSMVEEKEDGLHCVFFDKQSPLYDGKVVVFARPDYTRTRVANSFGHKEQRYKVKLRIELKGRIIRTSFTLSDRSLKIYPILLGRRLMHKKFLVDVSQGDPLIAEERKRKARLRLDLGEDKD